MKTPFKFAFPLGLMLASACAMASNRLTPHECNAYPFKSAHGEVTHRALMRELTELESVGYRPGIDNYSLDIAQARERLNDAYNADCKPNQPATSLPATNS
jgi:hypothetical protein